MSFKRTMLLSSTGLLVAACATSPGGGMAVLSPTASSDVPPQLAAITEADLRRDLMYLGGDGMRGREAGTLDEMRASTWIADRAREAGLEPAGEDGTYFQWWPMRRTRQSDRSQIAINGASLELWKEAATVTAVDGIIDAPIVWVESGASMPDVKGKVAAAVMSRPANAPGTTVSLSARRYAGVAIRETSQRLIQAGAIAVVLASDSIAESAWGPAADAFGRGRYGLDTGAVQSVAQQRAASAPPVIWVRRAIADRLRAPNARLTAALSVESFVYPSVNIVASVRGTDPLLRTEYVLWSGHQDHDGVRSPIAGDSIWNGADDNASVSVAMLAIGRAYAKQPGKRSALFVWHGAEERGLLGSRWHAMHPVVAAGQIVAVLNGDMIGRNDPDSAALLGAQPPHRNSTALVNMALAANDRITHFKLDTLWDRPTHPEGWYFRSDHLPYARAGIPSVFFSTLLHPDYHTPRDEPSRIDYTKLTKMTRWMYAVGWSVANSKERPGLDPGFKLER